MFNFLLNYTLKFLNSEKLTYFFENTSGKRWKELPDDYMVPMMSTPSQNCILIAGGDDEVSLQIGGGRYNPTANEVDRFGAAGYSIDAWR